MDINELKRYIISEEADISNAMQRIDSNSGGVLFIVDAREVLIGCITDGDIRRYLLSGGGISDRAMNAANTSPNVARSREEAIGLYKAGELISIPILDESGIVRDIYIGTEKRATKYSSIDIPIVINAGGKGTRLFPYTKVLPKPLIPVGDYPIIEHIIREFKKYNCNRIHIIVNYKKQLVKAYFAEGDKTYNICWYDEDSPLGTGGGLRLLKDRISETFFFTNCDNLLKADYNDIVRFHRENGNLVTMICVYKTFSVPYGVIQMGECGEIKSMKEKPSFNFLANTGIYVVEPEVIDYINDDENIGFPDIIKRVRDAGKKVAAYPVRESEWMDMGQLEELEIMQEKLSDMRKE